MTQVTGTLADLAGRAIVGSRIELVESDAGAVGRLVDSTRTLPGGRFTLRPRADVAHFVRVIGAAWHNGGFISSGMFSSLDPTGRDVWWPGATVDARVGLTWLAGRMADSVTRRPVRGVEVQARTTGPGIAPTVVTGRGGLFVVRGLAGPLVDEEYTVCVDGRSVGYQAGQYSPTTRAVEGTSCADAMGASASAGWLGVIAIDPLV
mgnify:CR=1 FL=1